MTTEETNLRTGKTLWRSAGLPRIPSEPLVRNRKADVVVIGAGITGAMAAQALSSQGFSVVILERRDGPLLGATMATTALLQYEIDEPMIELQKKIGVKNTARAWRRSKLGLSSLKAKIESLRIDCELEEKSSLYLAGNVLDSKALKEECAIRNSIGLCTDYLSKSILAERFGIKRDASLLSYGNLTANPVKMAAGFLRDAIKNGAQIYAPIKVVELIENGNGVTVKTKDGPRISARYVISTTGYEIPDCVRSRRFTVHSTYAIATRAQTRKLWPERPVIWESSDPYLYVRSTPEGRVICGGEDEDFKDEETRDSLLAGKTKTLEKKLKKLFPQLDTRADFAWCGSFGAVSTGLPTIGKIPGKKNCYAIMAFGGNGITYSRIAAEVVTSMIMERSDPDADLFAF